MEKGKVILIGAGPGDPELLTLKAVRHLQQADVILADRLVSPEIWQVHAPQAVIIPVGKQCRMQQSTPQATINALMIHHAQAGRYVIRLKGGDTSIFSNIAEELEALSQHGIYYEIVPGITAALGAAAGAGIPLTARGLARGIRLLTYYNAHAIDAKEWDNLAATSDTLVFYMSGATSAELAAKLILHGKPSNTPVLLAEQATTPWQILTVATLYECQHGWATRSFISPALLIIGDVAALHHRYAWQASMPHTANWFEAVQNPAQAPKTASIPPLQLPIDKV